MLSTNILLAISVLLFLRHANCQLYRGGLRFSTGDYSGRLLIESAPSTWGNICGLSWDWRASVVVCRQLSLGPPLSQLFDPIGGSSLPILEGQFVCNGSEWHLADCSYSPFVMDIHCDHSMDVTVQCMPSEESKDYRNYDIVTVEDEETVKEFGLLPLIYYRGSWHTICHTDWRLTDVLVLCRQLGFAYAKFSYTSDIQNIFLQLYTCLPEGVHCFRNGVHLDECLWFPQEIPSPRSYLHVLCENSPSMEATDFPPTTVPPPSDPGNNSYGLIVFAVLAACFIACFVLCRMCRTQTSGQPSGEPVQVVSIRSIEEETVLPSQTRLNNVVQELPNDPPPTYEQYVTNSRFFRTMSEQSDVLHDMQPDGAESPPPEYHHVTSVPSEAYAPAMRSADINLGVAPTQRQSSSNAVPVSPPPDYYYGNPFPGGDDSDGHAASERLPVLAHLRGAEEGLDTIPEAEAESSEPVTAATVSDNVDIEGNSDADEGGSNGNEDPGGGGIVIPDTGFTSCAQDGEYHSPPEVESSQGEAEPPGGVPVDGASDRSDSVSISSCTTTSSETSSVRRQDSFGDVSISLDRSEGHNTDYDSETGPEIIV